MATRKREVVIKKGKKISFIGEIVSIYEEDEKSFVKIHYNSGYIDVPIKSTENILLGDKIIIESEITVRNISPQTDDETIIA